MKISLIIWPKEKQKTPRSIINNCMIRMCFCIDFFIPRPGVHNVSTVQTKHKIRLVTLKEKLERQKDK